MVDLSLWLVYWYTNPGVSCSSCTTARSIAHNELELRIVYLIDSDDLVVVVKLIWSWEMSVLLFIERFLDF